MAWNALVCLQNFNCPWNALTFFVINENIILIFKVLNQQFWKIETPFWSAKSKKDFLKQASDKEFVFELKERECNFYILN